MSTSKLGVSFKYDINIYIYIIVRIRNENIKGVRVVERLPPKHYLESADLTPRAVILVVRTNNPTCSAFIFEGSKLRYSIEMFAVAFS